MTNASSEPARATLAGPLTDVTGTAAPGSGAPLASADRSRRMTITQVSVVLSLLLGLQPVTTDVYLPALPALTRELGAGMSAAQMTMSGLILTFGFGQLVCGPIADRVGRRPVLLWGLSLYTLAAVACALAPGIAWLVAFRSLQGIGMAAAVVCARAMVRDLYEGARAAQVMSLGLSGLGVIALFGPMAGGAAAHAFGWRGALALVACIGAAVLAFMAWRLPETLGRRQARSTEPADLLRTWWLISRNRVFVAWTLLTACTYGGLFTLLASSSFVYIDVLGLSPAGYGAALALSSLSYLLATMLCRRWITRFGTSGTVGRGAFFTLLAGLGMALLGLTGARSVAAVLSLHMVYAFGHGIHQPCGQAGVVGPFPLAAGAASALAGFILALTAFAVGNWLGFALDGTVRPMAFTVAFWCLLTCAVAWRLVRRLAI